MPQFATVSLVQSVAAGAPAHSRAVSLQVSMLERCWIDTSLRVLLLLVSIELEVAYPRLLVLQRHVEQLLQTLDIVLVPLRLPLWISSNSSSRTKWVSRSERTCSSCAPL